ncbi:MAG: hypothetical protein ACREP9_11860, partial [Candidatus Dormibacteraceae bacterium]
DIACRDRTDFFKLWDNRAGSGGLCFADDGEGEVNMAGVYRLTTGGNAGSLRSLGGLTWPRDGLRYCDHAEVMFVDGNNKPAKIDVTYITIVGRSAATCETTA